MIEVIPAILATSGQQFKDMVKKIEPYADRVQLDILDGEFTSDLKTIVGYQEVAAIETKLNFDVHLMVKVPEDYIYQFLKTKADRFFIQAESQGDLNNIFFQIHDQGRKAGIVLNPETDPKSIVEYLPMIDYIQFMTIHPGAYGRTFLPEVLNKIADFHYDHAEIPIVIDGGMNPETAKQVVQAGASILVSGSYIMNSTDVAKAISDLKNIQ